MFGDLPHLLGSIHEPTRAPAGTDHLITVSFRIPGSLRQKSFRQNMVPIFGCEIFEPGVREISLTSLTFPASVAIHAIRT
jgi:hypothetical protein